MDLLAFETCNRLRDAQHGLELRARLAGRLPAVICASTTDGSRDDHQRVRDLIELVRASREPRVDVGLNCCRGPHDALRLARPSPPSCPGSSPRRASPTTRSTTTGWRPSPAPRAASECAAWVVAAAPRPTPCARCRAPSPPPHDPRCPTSGGGRRGAAPSGHTTVRAAGRGRGRRHLPLRRRLTQALIDRPGPKFPQLFNTSRLANTTSNRNILNVRMGMNGIRQTTPKIHDCDRFFIP